MSIRALLTILCIVPALSCTGETEPDRAPADAGPAAADTATTPDSAASGGTPSPAPDPMESAEWTAGVTTAPERLETPSPLPVLTALRTGTHPGYERVTVEIGGEATRAPGYRVEYIDRPLRECGSGRQIHPIGDGWLELRIEPAAAHTEAGQATLESAPIDVDGPLLLRIYRTCDFEGVVTLVLALAAPNPYRVATLTDPTRIVLDVQR